MKNLIVLAFILTLSSFAAEPARRAIDLYVNPETASDSANGQSAESKAGSGPFKTIAHAMEPNSSKENQNNP